MSFAWPHLLWLLFIPAAQLVWELTHARRAADLSQPKILRAEAGADSLELSSSRASATPHGYQARLYLFAGLSLAIMALARPQWGRVDEPVFDQSREIVLALDLSRSMLTPDVKPSRLGRAKLLIMSLLERLAGERLGLVVFSGTAFVQSPLSADYEILREFLPHLVPDYLPEGGTNYAALIEASTGAFNASSSADRFLIILSDGEATDDNWRAAAAALKKKNIRVIGLGIGTGGGGMIPDGTGGFVKDDRGAVVLSKLESNTLRELATLTGGAYRDASTWVDLAALIKATVDAGRKGQFVEQKSVRLVDRYQWPLAVATLFLFLSFWREFPVNPKPRALILGKPRAAGGPSAIPPRVREPALAAIALLFLLLGSGFQPRASAQSDSEPAPGENGPPLSAQAVTLSKIVARLSVQTDHSARDWAELALDTITWGQRIQSEQPPAPPGPINDALAGVALGSVQDPKTADWPLLRKQLEALLQKPEEQQQEQQKDDQNQEKQDQDQKQEKSERKDSHENQNEKPVEGKNGKNAFGDMQEKQPPPPPPQPASGDTQKAGGSPDKKPGDAPPDPSLAMPLQKLDQLRDQDSPAKLFKLMQGDPQPAPAKKGKTW
jgi:Ca-activated chloride channel homolog